MKKIVLTVVLLWSISALRSQALFRLNQYNILYDSKVMPVFTLWAGQNLSEHWGVSAYFYVNGTKGSSWGEGLAGPVWTPVKGLSLAFLAGFQSNEDQLFRVSPIVIASRGHFSGFAAFEYGGKRHRWDVMAFYNTRRWKTGAELIRFYNMYAAGPRVELLCCKKQAVTAFLSGMWDWVNGKPVLMLGLYATFAGKPSE